MNTNVFLVASALIEAHLNKEEELLKKIKELQQDNDSMASEHEHEIDIMLMHQKQLEKENATLKQLLYGVPDTTQRD